MSKGSKQRPTNKESFNANFDRIFKPKPTPEEKPKKQEETNGRK